MSSELANIGLSAIRKITDIWAAGKSDSLIDYTASVRVEPLVLVDSDVLYLDMTFDVMQSLQSIFSGYYLQAVALSTKVAGVHVMRTLDRLNPSRSAGGNAMATGGWLLAQENYKFQLPTEESMLALEALDAVGEHLGAKGESFMKARAGGGQASFGSNATRDLKENANLSVGKMLMVTIQGDGQNKAEIPVSVRLIANTIPSTSLVHILSAEGEDTSVKERYHAWRAGRLDFVRDLVLCQDLISARRRNLMHAQDASYANILARARNNKLSTILSGDPSVATASNMAVISDTTAAQLELSVNGRLKDFSTREKIFDKTYLMILAVIDKQWERVTFYHRGLADTTEVSAKDLKVSNSKNGPDVSDILRAYTLGHAPSI